MTGAPESEIERLRAALRWLKSHRHRLQVDRRSLEGQLARLVAEIERLDREIERAEARLAEMAADESAGVDRLRGPSGR